ncbi:T9SS type A sorting domain-containing protein [Hymenobacter sp. BT635]|uniref:T9SS type A sorting domain-containing protein n=1 Tax=Hymenobacter nitidus TaxID=2880929 RepID=A0ABS8AGI2_9BACT|nr:T9SS type A sorting domain-containing protein [Hymenobacter nitidus]MCB2378951.1 T9SS type A sorting domain-containing protein [Hymenobacter nitidus]
MTDFYARLKFIFGLCAALLTFSTVQAQQLRPRRSTTRPAAPELLQLAKRATADQARGTNSAVVLPGQAMRYSWDRIGQRWTFPLLYTYSYDAAGRPTLTINGDSAAGTNGTNLERLSYDSRGNLVEQLIQGRVNPTAPWLNRLRVLWTYDAYDNYTLIQYQLWRNNAWETYDADRIAYTYSSSGAKLEEVQEKLNQGAFAFTNRHLYTYDARNRSTSVTGQEYENGSWVNTDRITDLVWFNWEKQWPTSYDIQLWNGTAWETDSRVRATWQPNGSFLAYDQYFLNNAWEDYYRTTVIFDDLGNLLVDTFEEKPGTDWAILRGYRATITYNAAGTSALRRLDSQYDEQVGAYLPFEKYYYASFVTLAARRQSILSVATDLYPNPATSTVTLVVNAPVGAAAAVPVEILNTLGQVVKRGEAQVQQGRLTATLEVGTLAAGVYTVRLLTPQGVVLRQLVRQ